MAKIYGLFGAMTGKLAESVMVVRNGVQIVRKYQPVVYNPSTIGQVAVRAKLKLLSQMSSIMAPYIAIRNQGNVSSRNLFTKYNYRLATYSNDTADIALTGITLTRGVLALPQPAVSRTENAISVYISGASEGRNLGVSRVIYVAFERTANNELRYLDSKVVTEAGTQGSYATTLFNSNNQVVVYAYGVRDNTEAARVAFGNLTLQTANMVAQLVTSRTLSESDVTLTETSANTLAPAL